MSPQQQQQLPSKTAEEVTAEIGSSFNELADLERQQPTASKELLEDEDEDSMPLPPPQRRRSSMLRASLTNFSPEIEAAQQAAFAEKPWPWSMFQGFSTDRAKMVTGLGCTSSCIVLAVRLYLDHTPPAYLIHSIIVFFDMILIHMFTHSTWLSVSGELITYLFFLLFHFTKETVWELLETTLLAILSSFYMIASRRQVMQERDLLEGDIASLRERGALLLRNISQVHAAIREKERLSDRQMSQSTLFQMEHQQSVAQDMAHNMQLSSKELNLRGESVEFGKEDEETLTNAETNSTRSSSVEQDTELTRELLKQGECSCSKKTFQGRLQTWLQPFTGKGTYGQSKCPLQKRMKCYRDLFFEHFLDGAAGVMYTSFLGLIIDACLKYGESKK